MKSGKTFDPSKLIQPHMFVKLTDDHLAEEGLFKGDLFYVAEINLMPFDENDLYLRRAYAIVHKHKDKGEIDTEKLFIIDPRYLEFLSKGKNKRLMNQFVKRYAN